MSFLMSWRRLCRTMWPFCVVCLAALLVVVLSRLAEQTGSNPIKASPVKRDTDRDSQTYLEIKSHLQLCRSTLSERQVSFIQDNVDALRVFIPEKFSNSFTNPCWYADFNVPVETDSQKKISETLTELEHTFSMNEATELLEKITSTRNDNRKDNRLVCLPAFYLAGFPKCGTSTLYELITAHPHVAPPNRKEGHFWSYFMMNNEYHVYQALKSYYYLFHFAPATAMIRNSPHTITLDASPSTIFVTSKHGPLQVDSDICMFPRIVSTVLPDARYIVIMRNPISRLWSDYWFYCAIKNWRTEKGQVKVPKEYLKHGPDMFHNDSVEAIDMYHSCLQVKSEFECARKATMGMHVGEGCGSRIGAGLYYLHIVKWLSVLPSERFLFLRTEDLATDSQVVMQKIWEFLKLSSLTQNIVAHRNTNSWIKSEETFQMLPKTKEMLSSFYEPYNKKLAALLRDDGYLWRD